MVAVVPPRLREFLALEESLEVCELIHGRDDEHHRLRDGPPQNAAVGRLGGVAEILLAKLRQNKSPTVQKKQAFDQHAQPHFDCQWQLPPFVRFSGYNRSTSAASTPTAPIRCLSPHRSVVLLSVACHLYALVVLHAADGANLVVQLAHLNLDG